MLASPQSKWNIFLSKFIGVQLLIVVFLFINQTMMFVDAIILHFKEPELHVLNQSLDVSKWLSIIGSTYLALSALCAIQFWMGLRFKNFIAPIAIGIALWFVGTIVVMQSQSGFALFFPYSFHVYDSFPKYEPQRNTIGLTSFIYCVAFLLLGFLDFKRGRSKA